jgi:hypothetical protein
MKDEEFGVASRKLHLRPDPKNSFGEFAESMVCKDKLKASGRNLAIQGEVYGLGIQNNLLGVSRSSNSKAFNLFDID